MDEQERSRLKKLYEQLSDEKLIELIIEDEEEYKKEPYEAYELLFEEAKTRGIGEKVYERRKLKMPEQQRTSEEINSEDAEPVEVFVGPRMDAVFLKSLLEANGINAFLENEIVERIIPIYSSAGGTGRVVWSKRLGIIIQKWRIGVQLEKANLVALGRIFKDKISLQKKKSEHNLMGISN